MSSIKRQRVFFMAMGYKKVEGELSIPEGMRVSDFLNKNSNDKFVSITNATVYKENGGFEEIPFLAVNKDHIIYLKENS